MIDEAAQAQFDVVDWRDTVPDITLLRPYSDDVEERQEYELYCCGRRDDHSSEDISFSITDQDPTGDLRLLSSCATDCIISHRLVVRGSHNCTAVRNSR